MRDQLADKDQHFLTCRHERCSLPSHLDVEVRRIFHKLRSSTIKIFNEQFNGIFDDHGQVPTKGLVNTHRYALGAILVYQLTLWYHYKHEMDLRVGLKPFLKAA